MAAAAGVAMVSAIYWWRNRKVFLTLEQIGKDACVVIAGSSRGIGRDTALMLANRGHRVFAGVRREQDG